jgi:hypothetical protein
VIHFCSSDSTITMSASSGGTRWPEQSAFDRSP